MEVASGGFRPQVESSGRGRRLLGALAVAVLAAVLLGVNLAGQPLLDPDESKHAEIAREMLVTGRLLRPIVNFEPYDDKPSAFYVLVGLCYRLFGVAEGPARLVSVVAGWLTLLATYWYAARRDVTTGLAAALLLAACPFFVGVARFTNFDALLTAAMTGAVLTFARWLDRPERRAVLFACYVLVAFAILVKGPLALALVTVPMVVAALRGDFSLADLWAPRAALAATLVVAAWALPAAFLAPDYLREFLWVHNVQRYLVAESLFHPEPIYFFVPVLLLGLLPWSPLVPVAWLRAWRRSASDRFLATYALWVVVFFSLSTGKLATYVLPAFPAFAVAVATWLVETRTATPNLGRRALLVVAGAMALLAPAAYVGTRLAEPPATAAGWVLLPASIAGVLALVVARSGAATTARLVLVLCAGMICTSLGLQIGAPSAVARFSSDADLARVASNEAAVTVAYQVRPYSYLFYAQRPVLEQLDDDGYRAALRAIGPLLLLTRERKLPKLHRLVPELRLRELARNERHVLYRVE